MDSKIPVKEVTDEVGAVDTPIMAPEENRKNAKVPIVGMITLGILAAAGIAFGIFAFMDSNNKAKEIADLKAKVSQLDPSSTDPTNPSTPDKTDVFEVMDTETRSLVAELKTIAENVSGVDFEANSDSAPVTKFDDLKAYTYLTKAYGISHNFHSDYNATTNEEIVSQIDKKLKSYGFVSDDDAPNYFNYGKYKNNETGVLCTIGNSSIFWTTCGYYKWVSDEVIEKVNAFAEAIKNKEGSYPQYALSVPDELTIVDSSVTPYQKTQISGGNAALLFYRVSPNADWQFFTGTQGLLECSDYNTQDLKNAYAGDRCGEGLSDSTVQP